MLLGTMALAQPALAQAVTCDQLKQLQELGKNRFADINGGPDDPIDPIYTLSTMVLDGAKLCHLDYLDTSAPTFACIWGGYGDQASAEAARVGLKNQVMACLPKGFKQRDRQLDSGTSSSYFTKFTFGFLQPEITVKRRYSVTRRSHTVEFTFQMSLPED
jgi:hypothetical protein